MAELEKTSTKTMYQRLFRAGEKPVALDPLWYEKSYEAVKGKRGKGRPKKIESENKENKQEPQY